MAFVAIALLSGCSHDFDFYDPRLGEPGGAGGSGAVGGGGGGSGGAGGNGAMGGGGAGGCEPGATASCYSGPPDTENVGLCRSGTTTCNADGSGFGPCEGEIVPTDEVCLGGDEDCDGIVNEPDATCACIPNTLSQCYEGDAATEDVGVCRGGTAICAADGQTYGPCIGQVLPSIEDCATAGDDDCSGAANEQCATWSASYGNSSYQTGRAVAVDANGDVVITGELHGGADFGGGTITSAGSGDVFVAKLDSDGNHLWSVRFGDAALQWGQGIATDPTGNVYVTGSFAGELDFTPAAVLTSAGLDDIFVVKLSPAGVPVWAVQFGDAATETPWGIAASAGLVALTGRFEGSFTIPAGPTLTATGTTDGFVIALDPDGAFLWHKDFGDAGDDTGYGIAIDANDDVAVAGFFDATVNFGGADHVAASSLDAFIAKFDSAGGYLWSHGIGGGGNQEGKDVAFGPNGSVVLYGDFTTSVDLGGGTTFNGAGDEDVFLAKYDTDGVLQWGAAFGDLYDQDAELSVATDPTGNVFFGVTYYGSPDFGGGPLLSRGSDDMALVELDPNGSYLWSRRFGNNGDQEPNGIATDAAGNLFVLGYCEGDTNFGNGIVYGSGGNACLAKVTP